MNLEPLTVKGRLFTSYRSCFISFNKVLFGFHFVSQAIVHFKFCFISYRSLIALSQFKKESFSYGNQGNHDMFWTDLLILFQPSQPTTISGLEKVPISPWLVTLLHICGVIPTPQLPETPSQYHRKLRMRAHVSAPEWWVFKCVIMFHDGLRVFHDVLLVVHDV